MDNPLTILLDKWYGFLFGFLIALVVIPAVTHRDLVLNSIKGIFNEPDDPRTPISYRATWLILTAGFVLYIIAGALMGIHIGAWILFVVTCSVLAIGLIRAVSANGGYFLQSWRTYFDGSWFSYIGVPIILLFGLTEANKTSLMSAFWMIEGDIARTLWGAAVSGILLLAFYKVGKLTKTKERSVLIGGAIGLALVSTLLVVFYAMHQQFMQAATVWSGGWSLMHLSDIWNRWKATGFEAAVLYNGMAGADLYSAPEYFVAAAMLGFVVLVVFSLLQRRFSWFIVSITGVFTGAMFGSILWMPLLMALLFKYLTLRVGGPRRYEQTGKPMAVGVLAGAAFVFVIQMLILYYNRVVILGYSAAA